MIFREQLESRAHLVFQEVLEQKETKDRMVQKEVKDCRVQEVYTTYL